MFVILTDRNKKEISEKYNIDLATLEKKLKSIKNTRFNYVVLRVMKPWNK